MRYIAALGTLALFTSVPANAQSALHDGLAGALRGCEEWVLNPASWADGTAPFLDVVGLGDVIGLVSAVPELIQPPEELRVANHYWRINSTPETGYFLVVSDRLPMCHITGGGGQDLQPVVAEVLASAEFLNRWELIESSEQDGFVTTRYRNREEPNFSIDISRATQPGQATDRVQVLGTAIYNFD